MSTENRRIFAVTDVDHRPQAFTTSESLAEAALDDANPDEELFIEPHERPAAAEDTVWVLLDKTHQVVSVHGRRDEAYEDLDEARAAGNESSVMPYALFGGTESVRSTETSA